MLWLAGKVSRYLGGENKNEGWKGLKSNKRRRWRTKQARQAAG
jgi:hypothetical protein